LFSQSGAATCKFRVGDITNSWLHGENRVFKFDQSEDVYFKFCVDDVNKMADERSQTQNRAEIVSNFANAGNSTKCELCKDLELQLSCVLNELSSVRLIVDLLSKEHKRVQSELPSDTTMNKQWTQVSYN
jgi:hypothetical protein